MNPSKHLRLLGLFLLLLPYWCVAQNSRYARVYDAITKDAVPFATIKYGVSGHGLIADLNGRFEIPTGTTEIEISSLGYKVARLILPLTEYSIYLQPENKTLQEIVVKPPTDKIRRIINLAIAHKTDNNPDKYEQYRCNVYYKMVVDMSLPDSAKKDTTKDAQEMRDFFDKNHLLMNETYSKRTWRKPQQLQEDVKATRFSGLKKSAFTSLVTDILPFHAYTDYFTLNGKDYHNPISRGFEQYYRFGLVDELLQDNDTIWTLSFKPKGKNANELTGTINISSKGYAITHIIARANDTLLKLNVRIEQEYASLPVPGERNRWFPKHLNYVIDMQLQSSKSPSTMHMRGNSQIDSVEWTIGDNFKFDKTHTVRLQNNADQLNDSTWKKLRPIALDAKETSTYHIIDSIGEQFKFDKYMGLLSKLPEGKIPIGILDMDITRLFNFNAYEKVRLGLGLQTNEKLIKWLSVGGWAGYGFGDTHWKYGVFMELYAGKYKDFTLTGGYTDDITDPGRIHLNPDLDKSYLKTYLLQRVDRTITTYATAKWRKSYWTMALTGLQQEILPQYKFALRHSGVGLSTFNVQEAALSLRYAYAERTAPIFGSYYSLGSKYPIVYGRFGVGKLNSGILQSTYYQAIMAISWHKHFNRIGYEHILVEGGKSWNDNSLPLSKLFAGNGFKYNTESNLSLYTFGGMMTIFPYEFYSDQFINVLYRHDFDWKLYKLETKEATISSAPNLCLQYNMLYGSLQNAQAQEQVAFKVPQQPYHEAGLLANNLVRVRYLNLYYLTMNIGYFYHVEDLRTKFNKNNGRFVFGFGIEL